MPSSTVENYLKQLYSLQQKTQRELVPMGKLARAMDVAPGTATAMIKTLAESSLVNYEPRSGVCLTEGGEKLALHVLRRHRLVEAFLVEVLGFDWAEVDEEAEELEHAISDKVVARIDAYLGYPSVDPHGDPIPSATGKIDHIELESLATCPVRKRLRVARVTDQDSAFLRFVEKQKLNPGVELEVTERDPAADSVTLMPVDGAPIIMGAAAAAKIYVQPCDACDARTTGSKQ